MKKIKYENRVEHILSSSIKYEKKILWNPDQKIILYLIILIISKYLRKTQFVIYTQRFTYDVRIIQGTYIYGT